MSVHKFPIKKKDNITHIARADLVPLAALYFKHVQDDPVTAQSLFAAFATQAPQHAAIELTNEQYQAFKIAAKHITEAIQATYDAYLKECEKY